MPKTNSPLGDLQKLIRRYENARDRRNESDKAMRRFKNAQRRLLRRLETDYFDEDEVQRRLHITKKKLKELNPRWAMETEGAWGVYRRYCRWVTIAEYQRLRSVRFGATTQPTEPEPEPVVENARFRKNLVG